MKSPQEMEDLIPITTLEKFETFNSELGQPMESMLPSNIYNYLRCNNLMMKDFLVVLLTICDAKYCFTVLTLVNIDAPMTAVS